MQDSPTVYRKEKGINLIEIEVSSTIELFNPIDPSPLNKKDIEEDIENYIVTGIRDFPLKSAVNIIVYLPDDEIEEDTAENIKGAFHNFFGYRAWSTKGSLRRMFKDARISLVMGLFILFASIIGKTILSRATSGTLEETISESFLVAGWVAMWHPIEKILYDWWPLKRDLKLYEKLRKIDVKCYPHSKSLTDKLR